MPGTTPRTVRCELVTFGPSSIDRVTVAETSRRSGALPAWASSCESAMEKHEAWAAATSSSGLVLPSERSVRDAQVTGRSAAAPLANDNVPFPWARSPSQLVVAVRSAVGIDALLWSGVAEPQPTRQPR